MASYEVHKDSEIYLAIATKNQNIVYLNVMKQIYIYKSEYSNPTDD